MLKSTHMMNKEETLSGVAVFLLSVLLRTISAAVLLRLTPGCWSPAVSLSGCLLGEGKVGVAAALG